MLELINITKSFNDVPVVDDISFSVSAGQIFGLVGPNGAGKTTTLRIILNIMRPDSGEVLYNQTIRSKLKRSLFGYLPEERGLYQRARVLDLLVYFGVLNRLSHHRAEVEAIRLLDKLGLVEYTNSRINELSKGMHNMPEVERLSDHICLINQGKIIRQGSLDEIKKDYHEESYYIESDNDLTFLRDIKIIDIIEEHNRSCKFTPRGKDSENKKIVNEIISNVEIKKFYRIEPTLNDIFIDLVQKEKPKKKS